MTTYTFKLYNSGYGYYEDYYTYEYSEYEFYDVDTVSISVLGDDPDYMTVENGEVTYPDFAWEDHFNWYSTYSQSEIYRFDWYEAAFGWWWCRWASGDIRLPDFG